MDPSVAKACFCNRTSWALLGACLVFCIRAHAQPLLETRNALTSVLAHRLLGNAEVFDPVEGVGGFRGILLAPPGSTLTPLYSADSDFGFEERDLTKYAATSDFVDKAVVFHNGYAVRADIALGVIWGDLIEKTAPSAGAKFQSSVESDVKFNILFRQVDDVDRLRAVQFLREPSDQFQKYQEYYDAFMLLQQTTNDLWRLHPSLSRFTDREIALGQLQYEWDLYGYRREIEESLRAFQKMNRTQEWQTWSEFKSRFDQNQLRFSNGRMLPRTFLFPAPANWMDTASWVPCVIEASATERVKFEVAKIDVIRPWMDLDKVLGHAVIVAPTYSAYVLSGGEKPTSTSGASGRLSGYIDSIILVRRIDFEAGSNSSFYRDHPLNVFAYPDSINLLAFVVRTLPRIAGGVPRN